MTPTADHTAKADQFHTMCSELFDHYVSAIGHDMAEYARKHGKPMDITFAHNDVTRMLLREQAIGPGVMSGLVAAAILKEATRKRVKR